jgi:methionyl-tRNA synthetase
MSDRRFYLTNALPYVNGDPHLGHALEFVQADVLARHRRARGWDVRHLSGTDDNALKNVAAATAAGVPVRRFVDDRASRFAALRDSLELSYDDFIRTSTDPRHRPGVERLWGACAAGGDLVARDYEGLYCLGCEAFLSPGDLVDGRCHEHGTAPERVAERNWFFRLSRHRDRLLDLLERGALRIEPGHRRNEVLALARGGLADVSVSRPAGRAGGWGIPVPGDPGQVIYVWFDALANYVTALGYGDHEDAYRRWWAGGGERVHVVGKGITRFHALLWPAILLSAGEPTPTAVLVHDYVTVGGTKISKSHGTTVDPAALAGRHGVDALRWWLVRDVPRAGDADFREEALAARADELADGLGNLVNRCVALLARHRPAGASGGPRDARAAPLRRLAEDVPERIDDALDRYDLRGAAGALWTVVDEANRFVSAARPWEAGRRAAAGDRAAAGELDAALAPLVEACDVLAAEVRPFLPGAGERIAEALRRRDPALGRALFRKARRPGSG